MIHGTHSQAGGIICFIDEVREYRPCMRHHCVNETSKLMLDTLFNLGKAEGSIDAGQMIKPALARGLQLVGATTCEFTLRFARSFPKHHA